MRKIVLRILAAAGVLALSSSAFALNLTPADCTAGYPCWQGSDPGNPDANDIETIVGTASDLYEEYKNDVGDGESGPLQDDYSTTYSNTPTDPNDALIEWDGPGVIDCTECYLLVKDGNQTPIWYVFDLSATWDGMEDIVLTDFWALNGAISHVALYSARECCNDVPEPGTLALFGLGIFGMGMMRRRRTI